MKETYNLKALCRISGSNEYNSINGITYFYETASGIWMKTNVGGLPMPMNIYCNQPVFGFHIHEGSMCTGTNEDPFMNAKGHYNPNGCMHPYHAGDLPPLFANKEGNAEMAFLSDRFTIDEIIGRVMIIHLHPDDFHTQPSGNSGTMIACGEIIKTNGS